MSEPRFTPGTWKFDGDVVTGMDSRVRFAGTPSNDIFDVHEWPDELHEEGLANARLIAAAPDLFKACRELLEMIDHQETGDFKKECWCTDTGTGYGPLVCGACHARAALAKALGETP